MAAIVSLKAGLPVQVNEAAGSFAAPPAHDMLIAVVRDVLGNNSARPGSARSYRPLVVLLGWLADLVKKN